MYRLGWDERNGGNISYMLETEQVAEYRDLNNVIRTIPFGFDATFFSAVGLLVSFTLVGLLASIDFSAAFTVFHKIFFPGKDNWLFDPRTDQIILLLPQSFFMDCAILILASIIALSAIFIAVGILRRDKKHK
jgi:integral membrane protein (TIGR01906 family)